MEELESLEESLQNEVESMPFLTLVSGALELFHYLTEKIQEQFLIPVIHAFCFMKFYN